MCAPSPSAGTIHGTGSPIPSTAQSLLPKPAAETTKDQRAALPQAGKGVFAPRRAEASEETCSNSWLGTVMMCPPPQCQGWQLPWVLFGAHVHPPPWSVVRWREAEGTRWLCLLLLGSPHPAPLYQDLLEPEMCHMLLLQLLVHQGQVAPRHRGCRMLPPALTSQPHCQEQHQLGAGMEIPSQSGLRSPGLSLGWQSQAAGQAEMMESISRHPIAEHPSSGSSALSCFSSVG